MSQVRFLAPSPLWDDLAGTPAAYRAPALLRFAGDDFIEQYQRTLAAAPGELRDFVALPETWRTPRAGLSAPPLPGTPPPLRLYQPVHGRFYLVAASLACRVPGLPEHTVDAAAGETVGFVLRRLTVTGQGSAAVEREWAWVKHADGSEGWTPAAALALAADEEVAPMFATTYPAERGRTRRVFAGLVPASRRETLVNARELAAPSPPSPAEEPRLVDFQRAVIDPWAAMAERWEEVKARVRRPDGTLDLTAAAHDLAAMEAASALILIDFAEFLERWIPPVWERIAGTGAGPITPAQSALLSTLTTRPMWTKEKLSTLTWTLRVALRSAFEQRAAFEQLPLVEATPANPDPAQPTVPTGFRAVLLVNPDPASGSAAANTDFAALLALLTRVPADGTVLDRPLAKQVRDALPAAPGRPAPQLPALPSSAADEWFVVRCVYQRPHCGRKALPVVSERSERFALTSFFDPDAPARQLRVALPVDTRPATLRKYDRNVAFVLSSQLRKQMSRAASLKDLMDGKAGGVKGGLDIGVICSFSIPIITICALILLMILVSLLNIIFWWLPLFKICFPVPKPK